MSTESRSRGSLGNLRQSRQIDISKAVTGAGDVIAIEDERRTADRPGSRARCALSADRSRSTDCSPGRAGTSPGTAASAYRTQLEAPDVEGTSRSFLDLGNVQHYVEVWLNGKLVGTLLWPPYRIDVTEHLKKGSNDLVWSSRTPSRIASPGTSGARAAPARRNPPASWAR